MLGYLNRPADRMEREPFSVDGELYVVTRNAELVMHDLKVKARNLECKGQTGGERGLCSSRRKKVISFAVSNWFCHSW